MRSSLFELRVVAIALATVAAIFAFGLTFVLFSDRIGGWPLGYVASGVFAIVAFLVVLPIARRYLSKSVESNNKMRIELPSYPPRLALLQRIDYRRDRRDAKQRVSVELEGEVNRRAENILLGGGKAAEELKRMLSRLRWWRKSNPIARAQIVRSVEVANRMPDPLDFHSFILRRLQFYEREINRRFGFEPQTVRERRVGREVDIRDESETEAPREKSTSSIGPKIPEISPSSEKQVDPIRPSVETTFEDVVAVDIGREGCWYLELPPLEIGDVIEADILVVEGDDVNWMIMSKKKFFDWRDGGDPVRVAGEQNVRARPIKWKAREGKWYFVLDAFLKHYPRKVSIRLRRFRKPSNSDGQ